MPSQLFHVLHRSMQGTTKTKNINSCTNRKTWLQSRPFSIEGNKNCDNRNCLIYKMTQRNLTVRGNQHKTPRNQALLGLILIYQDIYRNFNRQGIIPAQSQSWLNLHFMAKGLKQTTDCHLAVRPLEILIIHRSKGIRTPRVKANILLAHT